MIWTPYAVLKHHESKSRDSDLAGENLARFQREVHFMRIRSGQRLVSEPFFNPNLSLQPSALHLLVLLGRKSHGNISERSPTSVRRLD